MPKSKTTLANQPSTKDVLAAIRAFALAPNRGPLAIVDGVRYSPDIDAPLELAKVLVTKANENLQIVHITIGSISEDPAEGRRPGCDVLVAPGDLANLVQFEIMEAYSA